MTQAVYRWSYSPQPMGSRDRTYGDRHVITRDTAISGGIDTYGLEIDAPAIVVDPAKYPESYHRLLEEVVRRAEVGGVVERRLALRAVFDTVVENMPYSKSGKQATEARVATDSYDAEKIPSGAKIELSEYIYDGTGVCREQSLTAGALIELLGARRLVGGAPRVHRNLDEEGDGHQWIRYTSVRGGLYILDVAYQIYGPLEQVVAQHGPRYLLPGEIVPELR